MIEKPLLVRTPSPYPTEGLFSYVLRVSESNGYATPQHMLSLAQLKRGKITAAGFEVDRLAEILGQAPAQIRRISHRIDIAGTRRYKILDHDLGRNRHRALQFDNALFCPQCAEESGYIDCFWDLACAVACPKHGSIGLRACPACGIAIKWLRSRLLFCECGSRFADAEMPKADTNIVEVMRLIEAKLYRTPFGDVPNPCGLPLQFLDRLTLLQLLWVLDVMSRYGVSEGSPTSLQAVAVSAAALSDWPNGYYRYLGKIGERYLAQGVTASSIRKQFEPFYSAMFKSRVLSDNREFLRAEFIEFGLKYWGNAVLDTRMRGRVSAAGVQRFVLKSEYARRHKVWRPGLKRLIADGTVVTKRFKVGKLMKVVVDLQLSQIPQALVEVIPERQVARSLGLPVSVLNHLRKLKVFKPTPRQGRAAAWYKDDVSAFLAQGISLVKAGSRPTATVFLRDVMRIKLRKAAAKANIVAAIFRQEIRVVSRVGDDLGGLLLDKAQIDSLVRETRMQAQDRTYSQPQAAALTGLCGAAISDAIRRGFLTEMSVNNTLRIPESAIDRFNSRYAVLSRVAKDLGTSSSRLLRMCRNNGILVEALARGDGGPSQPVLLRNSYAQLVEVWQARSLTKTETRASDLESLGDYLERLRANGMRLPRTVGQPNKVVIARACHFSRHLLYKDRNLIAMLDKFDSEECRHSGVDALTPAHLLEIYLRRLRDCAMPLPTMRSGKLNKSAIAKAAHIDRNFFYNSPEIASILKSAVARVKATMVITAEG